MPDGYLPAHVVNGGDPIGFWVGCTGTHTQKDHGYPGHSVGNMVKVR